MSSNEVFKSLITDTDGDYSKECFMAMARQLLAEGRRPDRVFIAMLRAAYFASIAHSLEEHYSFLRYAHDDVVEWKAQFERETEKLIAIEKAKADQSV